MKAGETGTVLGPSTRWCGELDCHENLLIRGPFEGLIRQSNGFVTIDNGAYVKAQIFADQVVVRGRFDGDIRCSGAAFLESTAIVKGNIYSRRFSMDQGAVMRGQVAPDGGAVESPAEERQAARGELNTPAFARARQAQPPAEVPLFSSIAAPAGPAAVVRDAVATPLVVQPSPLTRSGRQLPSALAAFATGSLQPEADDAAGEESRSAVSSPWRVRTS